MLASLLLWALAQAAPKPPLEQGVEAFAAGRYEEAAQLLGKAVRSSPRAFEPRFLLGATLAQLGKTRDAIVQLREAHKLNPRHPDVIKLLSAQYAISRDFASAIALLRPVVASSAADEEMYLLLMEALQNSGDTGAAFELAQQAAGRFPKSPQVSCWMGFQLQFAARYEEARRYFEKAIQTAPDYAASYYLLADVLLKQQQFEQAVPHFRKAIELKPEDVEARLGLGMALAGLGEFAEAATELEVASKQAPEEARIHFQLSRLYYRLGDDKRAAREAELSIQLRPPSQPLVTEVPSILRGPH